MKIPISAFVIGLAALAPAALAAGSAASVATAPERNLAVVVVDSLRRPQQAFYDYNRIAEEFEQAFEARHWPVKVTFERFAANTESHDLELRLFYRGITDEFGERVYRAWTILFDHGTKRDFGVVEYRYVPRALEPMDDVIHRIFRGAGDKTALLIEPYVAPSAAAKQ